MFKSRSKVLDLPTTYMRFLKISFQYSWEHFLQDCLSFQPLVFLAPEGEAASQHAVQQNPTGPDVCHLACILVVQ